MTLWFKEPHEELETPSPTTPSPTGTSKCIFCGKIGKYHTSIQLVNCIFQSLEQQGSE